MYTYQSYSFSYSFNKSNFNCNEVPSDWEEYSNALRTLYDAYMTCINRYVDSNSSTLPPNVVTQLFDLLAELDVAKDDARAKLIAMIDALSVAPLNCFDYSLYTAYMASYSNFKTIAQKIDILLISGGDTIGIQPDIAVESTTIYPTDGITKSKTTKCVGVYMKQMDNGSEFIGKVTVDNPNPTPEESFRGYGDGKIIWH